MLDETVNTAYSDPLKSVADALDAAVHATKVGVEDAKASASNALPGLIDLLSRLTYQACYAVSYGVVFPVAFVVHVIPKENALVHGFVDGAHAAMDSVAGMTSKSLMN
jgi:hypothetical protein